MIFTFTPNAANNNIVIVFNNTGAFTTPTGIPPAVGNPFAGGTLLYNGISSPYMHTGLTTGLTYYYKAFSYDGTNYSAGSTANATPVPLSLNLTALIEGLYDGLTMVPDSVTVEMRGSVSPFPLIESKKILLNSAGQGTAAFNLIVKSTQYYIVLKHRNALETWSAVAQTFSTASLSYDFTTAASQAYGSNLASKSGFWCLFSGDVDQNGFIYVEDVTQTFISYILGSVGYLPTDINGDLITNFTDVGVVYVNNIFGREVKRPEGYVIFAGK